MISIKRQQQNIMYKTNNRRNIGQWLANYAAKSSIKFFKIFLQSHNLQLHTKTHQQRMPASKYRNCKMVFNGYLKVYQSCYLSTQKILVKSYN